MKHFLQIFIKAIFIAFFLISVGLLFISLFRPEWIKIAIDWVGELVKTLGNWNYLVAFLSSCFESMPIIGAIIPGMNIMVLVGGFWGKLQYSNLIFTIISAASGAMIGNFFAYWMGKEWGKNIITNYGHYIGVTKVDQKIMESQIQKNGFWYIVLGKFHGTLRAFIPFIAGLSSMSTRKFWLYNAIGSILWASVIVCIGVLFIENYEQILDNIGKIIFGILVMIAVYIFFFRKEQFRRYWQEKNREMEEFYTKK